jgi:hypothetical protein
MRFQIFSNSAPINQLVIFQYATLVLFHSIYNNFKSKLYCQKECRILVTFQDKKMWLCSNTMKNLFLTLRKNRFLVSKLSVPSIALENPLLFFLVMTYFSLLLKLLKSLSSRVLLFIKLRIVPYIQSV